MLSTLYPTRNSIVYSRQKHQVPECLSKNDEFVQSPMLHVSSSMQQQSSEGFVEIFVVLRYCALNILLGISCSQARFVISAVIMTIHPLHAPQIAITVAPCFCYMLMSAVACQLCWFCNRYKLLFRKILGITLQLIEDGCVVPVSFNTCRVALNNCKLC